MPVMEPATTAAFFLFFIFLAIIIRLIMLHRRNRTRYVQSEAALKQAVEEARQAERAKTAFLANISHEIRTPMNAIMGFAQLLQEDPAATRNQREMLQVINRSGRHLLALIDDILDMSRLESGNCPVQEEDCSIHQLFGDIASLFRMKMTEKNLRFETRLSDHGIQALRADAKKIRQICINLLANAYKFTPRGKVTFLMQVEGSLESGKGTLIVTVTDSGIGISPEEAERIFTPFTQTSSGMETKEGFGLGLSISRALAELMQGELNFSSTPGKGSLFHLTLPVRIIEPPREANVSAETSSPTRDRRARLLIVDDNAANRALLMRMLEELDVDIEEADTAESALQMITSTPPDLLLMDIKLPGKRGDDAIREIRRTRELRQLAIIAVTGSVETGGEERLLSAGANQVVGKPFTREQLFSKIFQCMPGLSPDKTAKSPSAEASLIPSLPVSAAGDAAEVAGKILVVDDNRDNQALLCSQLTHLGFDTDTAQNGREGLHKCRERHYDMIFADCAMPVMDGFEMVTQLRRMEQGRQHRTIVVATTGSPNEYRDRCFQAGMDDILAKPLLIEDLQTILDKYRITTHA